MNNFFLKKSARIQASSEKHHPQLKKSLWSINSPNEYIFHTANNDPDPEVIVDLGEQIMGNSVILYNRNSSKIISERLRSINIAVSVDGLSWVPVDFIPSDDQVHLGKGIPVPYNGMIRAIKLFRKGSNVPISLRNILIGNELEILEALSDDYTKKFLIEYNIIGNDVEVTRGGSKAVKKVFEVRSGYDMSPQISCIKIMHLGRFSNGLMQIANAIYIAEKINVSQIYVDDNERSRQFFNGKSVSVAGSSIKILLGIPGRKETILMSNFFKLKKFKELFNDFSSHFQILSKIRHAIIACSEVEPFPDSHVLVHIRSGDVFSPDKPVHRGYGQPPLAFYKLAIYHANPNHVHLVFEDRNNPVITELEKYLSELGIGCSSWSGSLQEDINIILKAKAIIAGFGSFIPGVVALSKNVEKIYGFNKENNVFGRLDIMHNVIKDVAGSYTERVLKNNWENSVEQRQLMITYPTNLLALDEKESSIMSIDRRSRTIYTIHHMAATGGTIISKAIAACTNAILLSEVNPYSWIYNGKRPVGYKPTALVEHLVQASSELDAQLKRQFFTSQLDICLSHSIVKNRPLLIREHSHSSFDIKKQISAMLTVLDEEKYSSISVVSIRHPLDSYISAEKKGWHKRLAPRLHTLDEYCQSLTMFLNYMAARPNCMIVRYEDFCIDPIAIVSDVGEFYKLRVDMVGINNILEVPASGFSGRKTEKIEIRKRQKVSPSLFEEVKSSKWYHEFCERFGYEVDPEADPIRSKLS